MTFARCFLTLAAVRAVTVVLEGDPVGALMLLGVALAYTGQWWALGVSAFVVNATMGGSNSLMLIGSIAFALALFEGRDLLTVLRVQAVCVYGFAAAHKLFPNFLSGDVIRHHAPWMPHPEIAAVGVVFVEMLLAVAVARRWPLALPVAAVAHLGFTLGVAASPLHVVSLAAFNGVMLLLVVVLHDARTHQLSRYSV